MKAIDILNHFISRAHWVTPDNTVDHILLGNSKVDVHRVMVTWISSLHAIRAAVKEEMDMLITHEPTFWGDVDQWNPSDCPQNTKIGRIKRQFIKESGLIIMRIHDVWDRFPQIGIPWAWAKFLDLGTTPTVISANGYQHRYDINPITVNVLAQRIAEKTKKIGEPFVQVGGDGSLQVSKIGIGTGCICNISRFQEIGCDVSVVCDDGSCYWKNLQHAMDSNYPFIRVNHGTSEEPGMITLSKYINDNFDDVKAKYFPHGCCYRLVGIK